MHETVEIRKEPTRADIKRLVKVAADTVLEIARADGALGHEAVMELYVEKLYRAVVAGKIRKRR